MIGISISEMSHAQISPGQNAMTQMAPPVKTVASASPMPAASPKASVNAVASSSSSPSTVPMTAEEKKTLTKEFKRALSNELLSLSHREKSELKQFSAAQGAKVKNWRETEKNARRKYFEQHMSGPERRDYVKAYLKRKEAFDQSIVEEANTNKKEWKARHEDLSKLQKEKEVLFQKSLDSNTRPDPALWPKGN